jgi:tripartite-type tricarboxylate transporter receptor subunit TctC
MCENKGAQMIRIDKGAVVILTSVLFSPVTYGEEFYASHSITLMSGESAGSSYDVSSRLLGRHLSYHIPGRPNVISTNMTGAAGLLAANHLYNQAPQDGSVILSALQTLAQRQAMGESNIKFDASKVHWLGSLENSVDVLYVWYTVPVKTLDEARKTVVSMAVTAPGSAASVELALSNNLLGTRFRGVAGYPSKRAYVAIEQGEVQGRTGESYNGLKVAHEDWLQQHKIRILLQFGREKNPELSRVPLALDQAKNENDRKVLEFALLPLSIGRAAVVGQHVPPDRVAILRAAYDATMKDPEFLADAKKLGLTVSPTPWQEIDAIVKQTLTTPADIIEKAKQAMLLR